MVRIAVGVCAVTLIVVGVIATSGGRPLNIRPEPSMTSAISVISQR